MPREVFTAEQLSQFLRITAAQVIEQCDTLVHAGLAEHWPSAVSIGVALNGAQLKVDAWKIPGGVRGRADWNALLAAARAAQRLDPPQSGSAFGSDLDRIAENYGISRVLSPDGSESDAQLRDRVTNQLQHPRRGEKACGLP